MKNFKTLFFLLLSTHFIHAQISGTVFLDFNANGQKDNSASFNEVGYQGITVTAFDASGAVVGIPATTDANGDYTIAGVTGQLRVEFTWTDNWLFPSASGSTSVQFVTAPITNIDLGVHYPEEHWDNINQTNPMFLIPCFADGNTTIGPNSGDDAVVTFKNNDTGLTFTKGQVAIHSEIGALWGVAFQKTADRYFSSAFLKRHVGLGDKGLGGVYIFDTDATDYDLTGSFDLNGVSPSNGGATLDFGAVTRVISPGGNDNYLGSGGASRDMDAYGKVGTVGFGDINFGPDGKLYLVNLFQKSIIVVDVSGTTTSLDGASTASLNALTEAYSITAQTGVPTCANGELRPFALTFHRGKGYLGVICDGQDNNKFSVDDVEAYVLSFDPANIAGGFTQEVHFDNFDYRSGARAWRRWSHTWADTHTQNLSGSLAAGQPILCDIEFDEDGDMIVGFMDRFGHQIGSTNYEPTSGSGDLIEGIAHGDLLHVCKNGNSWDIEGTGTCPTNFTTAGNLLNDYSGNTSGSVNTTGAGEFYNDAQGDLAGASAPYSGEASNGALAKLMGSNLMLNVVMDPYPGPPTDGDFATYGSSGGIHWFNNTTGAWSNHARIYDNSSSTFRKAHGLGDIEPNLTPAPIEIGNFVWEDTNLNGVQDPGEAPISGVSVELYHPGSTTVISTAITDANGNYIFSTRNGTDSGAFKYNLSLNYGDNYEVRIVNAEGGSQQAALSGLEVTVVDSDASANGNSRDSDGTDAATSVIAFQLGEHGENNHTFDFGFRSAASSCPPLQCLPIQITKTPN